MVKESKIQTNNVAKNHLPADGKPATANQVLCPAVLSINDWPPFDDIIRDNLEKYSRCGQTFYIGYVATDIPSGLTAAEVYDLANKEKNKIINEYLKPYRKGRCVRGYHADGTPILCWKKSCKGCSGCDANVVPYERYNPDAPKEVSLEEHIEVTGNDYADKPTVFYGDEEKPRYSSDAERIIAVSQYLKQKSLCHHDVFLMLKDKKSVDEIRDALGLAPSSNRVYTLIDETMQLSYEFFGSGILSKKAIRDFKKREKEAKKNLLF